jgi:hypothetical protein
MRKYVEQLNLGATWGQLQLLGNAFVRRMIFVAPMPSAIALLIAPTRHQPDLGLVIDRTHDFHAKKACCIIEKVRPTAKGATHLIRHIICNLEAAQRNEHWGTLLGGGEDCNPVEKPEVQQPEVEHFYQETVHAIERQDNSIVKV